MLVALTCIVDGQLLNKHRNKKSFSEMFWRFNCFDVCNSVLLRLDLFKPHYSGAQVCRMPLLTALLVPYRPNFSSCGLNTCIVCLRLELWVPQKLTLIFKFCLIYVINFCKCISPRLHIFIIWVCKVIGYFLGSLPIQCISCLQMYFFSVFSLLAAWRLRLID
jgi:hypothetical protein